MVWTKQLCREQNSNWHGISNYNKRPPINTLNKLDTHRSAFYKNQYHFLRHWDCNWYHPSSNVKWRLKSVYTLKFLSRSSFPCCFMKTVKTEDGICLNVFHSLFRVWCTFRNTARLQEVKTHKVMSRVSMIKWLSSKKIVLIWCRNCRRVQLQVEPMVLKFKTKSATFLLCRTSCFWCWQQEWWINENLKQKVKVRLWIIVFIMRQVLNILPLQPVRFSTQCLVIPKG